MRHKHQRARNLAEHLQQKQIHLLSGHFVETGETLIHQQHRRIRHQGAGNADARFHAAR